MKLMKLVDKREEYMELIGTVPTVSGDVVTSGSHKFPDIRSTLEDAARELGFSIHGAALGQGIKKLNKALAFASSFERHYHHAAENGFG